MESDGPVHSRVFGSRQVISCARSVGTELTHSVQIDVSDATYRFQRSGRQKWLRCGLTPIAATCPELVVLGLSVIGGMVCGRHFCRAVRPTERDSGKTAEPSHSFVTVGGDMGGDIMYPPSYHPLSPKFVCTSGTFACPIRSANRRKSVFAVTSIRRRC